MSPGNPIILLISKKFGSWGDLDGNKDGWCEREMGVITLVQRCLPAYSRQTGPWYGPRSRRLSSLKSPDSALAKSRWAWKRHELRMLHTYLHTFALYPFYGNQILSWKQSDGWPNYDIGKKSFPFRGRCEPSRHSSSLCLQLVWQWRERQSHSWLHATNL